MNFSNLTMTTVFAGLLALAAITFFLQWIRIRHKQKKVATLIFWQKVMEQTRATTFWDRFRHLWAYLIVLAICSLLWLAMSGPESKTSGSKQFTVLLLDGSALMTRPGRFEQATKKLVDYTAGLPNKSRQVYWVGGETVSLLAPGEHQLLLQKRLEGQSPELAQSGIERQLTHLAKSFHNKSSVNVVVFGDSPIRKQVLEGLPKSFQVSRATSQVDEFNNAGVTSLGIARSASGDWFSVDVFLQVQSTDPKQKPKFTVLQDGSPFSPEKIEPYGAEENSGFVVRNVPAAGGLVEVKLDTSDSFPVDDSAKIRLPKVEPVRVAVAPALLKTLQPILMADPAVKIVQENPQVQILDSTDGASSKSSIPTLRFVAQKDHPSAFVFGFPESLEADQEFLESVGKVGLDQIDATQIADAAGQAISVSTETTDKLTLSVWKELLSDQFNFTRSRSFPIFVSGSLRWLSRDQGIVPFASVGNPLWNENVGKSVLVKREDGKVFDLLGKPVVPSSSGELKSNGQSVEVGLLSPEVTMGQGLAGNDSDSDLALAGSSLPRWGTLLLLCALVLASAEWYLFQTGRMP